MTRGDLKVRLRVGSSLGLVGTETDWTEPVRFGPTRYFDSECGPLLDTPPYFYFRSRAGKKILLLYSVIKYCDPTNYVMCD